MSIQSVYVQLYKFKACGDLKLAQWKSVNMANTGHHNSPVRLNYIYVSLLTSENILNT